MKLIGYIKRSPKPQLKSEVREKDIAILKQFRIELQNARTKPGQDQTFEAVSF